ncbi:MAG: hypothetical protein LUB63_06380, partial [Oscillospiraceae bacterium]|nr:hypothetical protein [Oscillospiraceae bacterium]
EYFDWCSDLESDLSGLSAVDTIFIYDWDDTATTTCYGWVASGETHTEDDIVLKITNGAAVIRVGTNWDRPFLEYMEGYANITDRSADPSGEISSSGYGTVWYSNIKYTTGILATAASLCTPDGDLCLISSLYMKGTCETTLDGNYEALKATSRNIGTSGYYRSNYGQAFELLYGLGDDDFPGIIVRNQDTYDSLVSNALWNLDFFDSVGYLTSGAYYYTYGSSDATTDKIYSDITGEYGVYINPTGGIGSWVD